MAAHGFLIDHFFWKKTNTRTDEYGGDLVNRTRFASEVIAACRRAVSPEFPISLRISQWKYEFYTAKLVETPEQLKHFIAPLVDAGVTSFMPLYVAFGNLHEGSDLNLSGWIKKLTGKPTITVGSVGLEGADFIDFFATGEQANGKANKMGNLIERLEREEFDLVAVGRALLADPYWVNKIRDGRIEELIPLHVRQLKHYIKRGS